jgi:hypothetical protein
MTFKQAIMSNKPWSHTGNVGFSAAGLVAKLRNIVKIEVPVGYQDEAGFHYGVKTAEKQTNLSSVC